MDKNIPEFYKNASKNSKFYKDLSKNVVPGKSEKYSFWHKNGVQYRLKRLAFHSKGKVLDIGYAFGINPFLKEAYGLDVFIPEIKPKNYKKFFSINIDKPYPYPFKDKYFDSVIAGEVIEHIPDTGLFMTEMNRILKKGGLLCLSTPNPESPVEVGVHFWHWLKGYDFDAGIKGGHVHEFPTTNMITLMKNYGFKVQKIEGTYIQVPFTNIQLNMNIVPLTYCTIYVAKKIRDI